MTNNKFKNKPNKIFKTENGHLWHSRSNVVIGHVHAIINDGSGGSGDGGTITDNDIYVLIGTRGSGKHKGFYNVPCGYLDWSETIENAVNRELYEEAGLYMPDWQDCIKYETKNSPWFINSEPSVTLQNVLFHCGYLMELPNIESLPKVHLENMEPGECEHIEWITLNNVKQLKDKFCFNHFDRIIQFQDHCYQKFRGELF